MVRIRWEAKMTKKNRVASIAIVLKRGGTLRPGILDLAAKNIISENARKSGVSAWVAGLASFNLCSRNQ